MCVCVVAGIERPFFGGYFHFHYGLSFRQQS